MQSLIDDDLISEITDSSFELLDDDQNKKKIEKQNKNEENEEYNNIICELKKYKEKLMSLYVYKNLYNNIDKLIYLLIPNDSFYQYYYINIRNIYL